MIDQSVVRFTEDEARAKIGKSVRALTGFAGVPVGSTGSVVEIAKFGPNAYDVLVAWNITFRSSRSNDRFSKSGYERRLEETRTVAATSALA